QEGSWAKTSVSTWFKPLEVPPQPQRIGFSHCRNGGAAAFYASMNANAALRPLAIVLLLFCDELVVAQSSASSNTVRVAAAQAARRVIDFRLKPEEALAAVEKNLSELERIVARAGEAHCDALVLPEDTPGLLNWAGANEASAKELLPNAANRMIERLGNAAA